MKKGTYFAIGADLAKYVAPEATITLEVLPTAGSAANIKAPSLRPGREIRDRAGRRYQAFIDRAAEAARRRAPSSVPSA